MHTYWSKFQKRIFIKRNKPKPNTSSKSDEVEYKGSYSGNKSEYIESRSSSNKNSSKGLTSKLKKDFELVRENINLTNVNISEANNE